MERYRIPEYNDRTMTAPHVVIIGAGASLAACGEDRNGNKVPILKNIAEIGPISELLLKFKYQPEACIDFESFYSDIYNKPDCKKLCLELENEIYNYFSNLELPDKINLYDYLLLSLTKKDLIISFNWDPFLLQAYKRNMHIEGVRLPQISFPHGNVGVGICYTCKTKGYYNEKCNKCKNDLKKMPLLFPIGQKNYEKHSIIRNEWEMARRNLEKAAGITIFGYSAPVTDTSAVELLKCAFQESNSIKIAPFTIINLPKERKKQCERWRGFYDESQIVYCKKFQDTILWKNPRLSLESHYSTVLQQRPFKNSKSMKKFKSLFDLQEFIKTITY